MLVEWFKDTVATGAIRSEFAGWCSSCSRLNRFVRGCAVLGIY